MKGAIAFLLFLSILFSAPAVADQRSELAASKLLDSMDMKTLLDGAIEASLDSQISQSPEMAPYKEIMRAFCAKYMSYDALRPKLVSAYASEFSASELSEAAAFYATPTGKKILSKLPTLLSKGAEIGQEAVKDHIPELQQAIQAESQRLQQLQNASKSASSPPSAGVDPYQVLPGKWGWEGTDDCQVEPQSIRFSERGKRMHLSLSPESGSGVREPRRDATYEVLGSIANGLSMAMDGENRLDASGKPVTWDLVLLSKDQYCWHRGDWPATGCTKSVNRCEI